MRQMSFRDLTRPDPFYEHGRRVSTLVTPFGNLIEIADESPDEWRSVLFREVWSAYLNDLNNNSAKEPMST